MLKQHQKFFNIMFQFFDLFMVAMAWLAAYPLRLIYLRPIFPVRKGIPLFDQYAVLTFGIVVLWYVFFHFTGVYKSRRTQSVWPELLTIWRACTGAFVILAAGTFL